MEGGDFMAFSEIKLFQVKPDRMEEFEKLIVQIVGEQKARPGCLGVKYFSYWEFSDKEKYADANNWFFEQYSKQIMKLLIMPFDIYLGDTIA
jgi:quinol monooxygenase YgiN